MSLIRQALGLWLAACVLPMGAGLRLPQAGGTRPQGAPQAKLASKRLVLAHGTALGLSNSGGHFRWLKSYLPPDVSHAQQEDGQKVPPTATGSLPASTLNGPRTAKLKRWFSIAFVPIVVWVSLGSGSTSSYSILACWMLSGVTMQVGNKYAAVGFQASALLVIIQMLIADVLMLTMQYRQLKYKDWRDLLKWSIVPFLISGLLASSVYAYKNTSISTVLVLRNILPLITFAGEKLFLGQPKKVTIPLVMSMLTSLAGTVLYGSHENSVSLKVSALIFVNCLFAVTDRLVERYLLSSPDFSLSPPTCTLMNNTLGIIPMVVLAFSTGEVYTWSAVVPEVSHGAWFWVIVSGVIGCCYGFQGVRLQKMVPATAVLMLQNFSKVVVIFLDICLNQYLQMGGAVGCAISMIGAFCYGREQLVMRKPGGETPQNDKPTSADHQSDETFEKDANEAHLSTATAPASLRG